ncbi:MAG TPA: M23 family metallopeptidase [Anaerolineae bacterium]
MNDEQLKDTFVYLDKAINYINEAAAQVQHACDVLRVMDPGGTAPERVLFCSPVTGVVGDVFGGDWFDATGYGKQYGTLKHYHTGVDLNRPGYKDSGSNVYAAADGVIKFVGRVTDWQGEVIVIEHTLEDGRMVWTRYAHIYHSLPLSAGLKVKRGTVICVIADYGGDGPKQDHLHYDVARIGLGSKPGDWPGMSLVRVVSDYIDPVEWHTLRAK